MGAPGVLFSFSVLAVALALWVPGARDILLVAMPALVASLYLLLLGFWGRKAALPSVVVDGSNVMHWLDGKPRVEPLLQVVAALKRRGFAPGVVFDANVGHKLAGHSAHEGAMAKLLGLPVNWVIVVGKGVVADAVILQAARDLQARIVTNDRFREWVEAHPEVAEPGFLIRGGFREGVLWLDLESA